MKKKKWDEKAVRTGLAAGERFQETFWTLRIEGPPWGMQGPKELEGSLAVDYAKSLANRDRYRQMGFQDGGTSAL